MPGWPPGLLRLSANRKLALQVGVRVPCFENSGKGNRWTHSFWARFTTEHHSLLLESEALGELREVIDRQLRY